MFQKDLKFGEVYQNKFLELINFDSFEMPKGCFKPYDLKVVISGVETKYEVKADRLAVKSGNIAIEFECSNKPSGITTTEADYWVYFIVGTNNYYVIPTTAILSAITERKFKRTVKGGDGWRSNMYLFAIEVFEEYKHDYEV